MHWEKPELEKMIKADDLHIAPFRDDGKTYGTPTFIWSVAVEGNLYVRAYSGTQSSWYRAAMKQKAGKIVVAGSSYKVSFEPVDDALNDRIDAAYQAKYPSSRYLEPMISKRSRAATVRILPQVGS